MSNPAEVYHHQHHHHHVQSPTHGVGGFGQPVGSTTNPAANDSYFNAPKTGSATAGPLNPNATTTGNSTVNPSHHHGTGHHHQGATSGLTGNNRGYDNQTAGQYPADNLNSGYGANTEKPLPGTRHDHHHGHHQHGLVDGNDSSLRSPTSGNTTGRIDNTLGSNNRNSSGLGGGIGGNRPYSDGHRGSDLSNSSSTKSGLGHSGRTYDNTNTTSGLTGNGNSGLTGNGHHHTGLGSNKNDSVNMSGANDLNGDSYGHAGRRHSPTQQDKPTFGDKLMSKISGKHNKRNDELVDGDSRMAGSYENY